MNRSTNISSSNHDVNLPGFGEVHVPPSKKNPPFQAGRTKMMFELPPPKFWDISKACYNSWKRTWNPKKEDDGRWKTSFSREVIEPRFLSPWTFSGKFSLESNFFGWRFGHLRFQTVDTHLAPFHTEHPWRKSPEKNGWGSCKTNFCCYKVTQKRNATKNGLKPQQKKRTTTPSQKVFFLMLSQARTLCKFCFKGKNEFFTDLHRSLQGPKIPGPNFRVHHMLSVGSASQASFWPNRNQSPVFFCEKTY